jgi:hypothetical protein
MLCFSVAVVLLSVLLETDGSQVNVKSLPSLSLPPLCASKALFNVECPGCGLTRSFVSLAHGRWNDSLTANRVGWFIAAALLLQIGYRLLAIALRRDHPLGIWVPRVFGWTVIAALVGNWLLRVAGH